MRLLLIDTCAASGGVALADEHRVLHEAALPERTASASLLSAVRTLLDTAGWTLASLTAVGVVHGPGSFTGVRVGLAAAKGLCEALSPPMAAVSRLEVLADVAGITHALAVLDAGRGEAYIRDAATESLVPLADIAPLAAGREVVVAEPDLLDKLHPLHATLCALTPGHAHAAVLRCLANGGSDPATTDANYVRTESQIYAPKASPTA